MTTNQKIAQKLRETAARLIKQAEELEAGIDRSKCIHGIYTDEPFTGCKTCGGKRVICSNDKVIGRDCRNSKGCNPACPYFEAVSNQPSADSSEPLEVDRESLEVGRESLEVGREPLEISLLPTDDCPPPTIP